MIVNVKSKVPFDLYIGRENKSYNLPQSKWANPFVIGKDGDREYVIQKYQMWLDSHPDLLEDIHIKKELDGKTLGCWCNVDNEACHGQILEQKRDSRWPLNWFSNIMPMEPLQYQGITFFTAENFYQAMKLPKDRIDLRKQIADMEPKKAKIAIRDKIKYPWDEKWTKEKGLEVMEFVLRHKFQSENDWGYWLNETEDWEIVEWNNWNDIFWGKHLVTRQGENHLGKILMKIREENRKKPNETQ